MPLAIDFWLLMHYISLVENNGGGRADSPSIQAIGPRGDSIHGNGFGGGFHDRRWSPVCRAAKKFSAPEGSGRSEGDPAPCKKNPDKEIRN
jgi:hypothetical protein